MWKTLYLYLHVYLYLYLYFSFPCVFVFVFILMTRDKLLSGEEGRKGTQQQKMIHHCDHFSRAGSLSGRIPTIEVSTPDKITTLHCTVEDP